MRAGRRDTSTTPARQHEQASPDVRVQLSHTGTPAWPGMADETDRITPTPTRRREQVDPEIRVSQAVPELLQRHGVEMVVGDKMIVIDRHDGCRRLVWSCLDMYRQHSAA